MEMKNKRNSDGHLLVHLCNYVLHSNKARSRWDSPTEKVQEPRKCVRSTPGKAEEAMVAQGASPMGSVGLNWHQGIAKQTGDMLPVPLALPGLSQSPLL